jgi:two-component system, OmpR family, sensor kinase
VRRIGLRHRLFLVVVAAVIVVVAALVVGYNLILGHSLDQNTRDLVRSRARSQVASLRVVDGHIVVGEAPDDRTADTYLWVFENGRRLEGPSAPQAVEQAARRLAQGPSRFAEVASTDTRLYSQPIRDEGRRVGSVVAGVSLAPYEETRQTSLVASLVFGAAVIGSVALVAWWVLRASFRPVVRMTRQAANWSEHDLDHRFAQQSGRDELAELANTLDGLLDRIAASIRRERTFSAELSHELRTPIARVLIESELALRRPREPAGYQETLQLIHGNADQLARTVEALVAAARHETGDGARGTADAADVATGAIAACESLAAARSVSVDLQVPDAPLRLGVEPDLAQRILQPVLENACQYAVARVSVSARRTGSRIVFEIDDDGPGVADDERERIFEPGVRGRTGIDGAPLGSGLGLSLARRLARSVGGEVTVQPTTSATRFVVSVPTG